VTWPAVSRRLYLLATDGVTATMVAREQLPRRRRRDVLDELTGSCGASVQPPAATAPNRCPTPFCAQGAVLLKPTRASSPDRVAAS
jgi:hypothetical protein